MAGDAMDGLSQLVGGFHIAAAVMAASGVAKLVAPRAFDTTLRGLSRRGLTKVPWGTGRVVGAAEIALGVAAVAIGSATWAIVVAAAYAGFAGVVVMARRRGMGACGCFGESTAPPSTVHVVVDLVAAAFAVVMAIDPPGTLGAVLSAQPWTGLPYVAGVALGSWFTVLVLTRGALVASLVAATTTSREQVRRRRATGGHAH